MSQRTQTTAYTALLGNRARNSDRGYANIFPIVNASSLTCSYRLWDVIGLNTEADDFEQNRMSLRVKISREVKGPAEIFQQDDHVFLAIPDGYADPPVSYSVAPHVVTIQATNKTGVVDFGSSDANSRFLGTRFLQSVITDVLRNDYSLWQPKAGRPFYFKNPANSYDDSRNVDVFEGFAFRIAYIFGVGYCVLIDCRTRYVSAEPWPEIIPANTRWDYLRHSQTDDDESQQKTTHCVYRFGEQWYEILVQNILKENIGSTLFLHPKTNIPISLYDYTLERWQDSLSDWCNTLNPAWTAVTYVTWADGPKQHATAHLCYPVLQTFDLEKSGLGHLHRNYAIRSPEERLNAIMRYIDKFFQGSVLGTNQVEIDKYPLEIPRRVFTIPRLEFGGGSILDANTDDIFRNYPQKRMQLLQEKDKGFWDKKPLQEQWVLIPREIRGTIWQSIRKDIENEIQKFSGKDQKYSPREIVYDNPGSSLYQQAQAIKTAIAKKTDDAGKPPSGYCLAILPPRADDELPAYLTSHFSQANPPLHIACIHFDSFARFYTDSGLRANIDIGRFRGYIRNVAVKLLILNSRWPFVVASQHSKDSERFLSTLFIGFDVLNNAVGFTFVGNGGRICFFASLESEDKESITTRKVREIIKKNIESMPEAYGWSPDHVILVRDGRLFTRELNGFKQAIEKLKLKSSGAVEVPKSSVLGVRLFNVTNKLRGTTIVRNPRLGITFNLSGDEIAICTTGWPFQIQGTSKPLIVKRIWGTIDISQLGEDMFSLAQLAWTAPDRPARYPLVIRYTDMRLRAIAADFDEEEIEFGPEETLEPEEG